MATIKAGEVLDKVEIILVDETNVRWSEDELLGWLNDGQREVVIYKPDATATCEAVELVAGVKQTLPTGGLGLLDVTRNMGTDGETPGRSITLIDKTILDAVNPNWPTATESSEVKHYMFDDRFPTVFFVYPPQPSDSPGYIEEVYTDSPTDCTNRDETLSIADVYSNALINYILHRAYAKDADYDANDARVQSAWNAFLRSLGVQDQKEAENEPNFTEVSEPSPSIAKGG
jgi:hypothetical protein